MNKPRTATRERITNKTVAKPVERNNSLYDIWSITHFTVGIIFGWLMNPVVALAIMILWEPLENLVLSPFLAKYNITFGFETLRNSLSDIFFDTAGIVIGAYILGRLLEPPFYLF